MNYVTLLLCISSMICGIIAALIAGEYLPPIDPIDLSVGLMGLMALFFAYMAADNSKGDDDGKDQE